MTDERVEKRKKLIKFQNKHFCINYYGAWITGILGRTPLNGEVAGN